MENKSADQPAFPIDKEHLISKDKSGLTKREYFAAMAMQGFCASGIGTEPNIHRQLREKGIDPDKEGNMAKAIAIFSIECADALLTQLNQSNVK